MSCRIITCVSMAGGVGHTTLVRELAMELGKTRAVAILDLETPVVSEWPAWQRFFLETKALSEELSRPPSLGVVFIESKRDISERPGFLQEARGVFDFLLVHLRLSDFSCRFLCQASDLILVPLGSELGALLKIRHGLELLDSYLMSRRHVLGVASRTGRSADLKGEDRGLAALGVKVLAHLPEEPRLQAEAFRTGTPCVLSRPESSYGEGVRQLAQRLEVDETLYRALEVASSTSPGKEGLPDLNVLGEVLRARLVKSLEEISKNLPKAGMTIDRPFVESVLNRLMAEDEEPGLERLSVEERRKLSEEILHRVVGLGPLEELLAEERFSEVMVRGTNAIWIERGGKLERTGRRFKDLDELSCVIERIISPLGRRVDQSVPLCDARLPDGSRVNIVVPPVALDGPEITIRKFRKHHFSAQELVEQGALSEGMMEFLARCVRGHQSLLVSGGTGSGKTTLLNVLSSFIASDERIVTIEDAAELRLQQDHVVRLEARPPNLEGAGAVTIRQLLVNALRMRPDRIIIGECRGAEALDLLQALNTGHKGSLTTLHANAPREALSRLEVLSLMAGLDLPLRAVREQICGGVDVIVQVSRLRDGSRKVVSIAEVVGMEGEIITLSELYAYRKGQGSEPGGFESTGLTPQFLLDEGE